MDSDDTPAAALPEVIASLAKITVTQEHVGK